MNNNNNPQTPPEMYFMNPLAPMLQFPTLPGQTCSVSENTQFTQFNPVQSLTQPILPFGVIPNLHQLLLPGIQPTAHFQGVQNFPLNGVQQVFNPTQFNSNINQAQHLQALLQANLKVSVCSISWTIDNACKQQT